MKRFVDRIQEIAVTFLAFCAGVFVTSLIFTLLESFSIDLVDGYVMVVTMLVGVVTAIAGNVWLDTHR